MRRAVLPAVLIGVGLIGGCGKPDTRALQILACQQMANSIDVQSVSQLDLLRKALGLAPNVDPIGTCRELGVPMTGQGGSPSSPGEAGKQTPANEERE